MIYDICLIFMDMDDPTDDPYPHGYEYWGKSIPTSEYEWSGLFFCSGYGFEIIITCGIYPLSSLIWHNLLHYLFELIDCIYDIK